MKRFFPLTIHFILACAVVGLAAGCAGENVRPIIQYAVNGLAFGLGISAFFRIFSE